MTNVIMINVTKEGVMMSKKIIESLAVMVISRLLEFISGGGFKIIWMDWSSNRVTFEMDPENPQVKAVLEAAGQAGAQWQPDIAG